MWPALRPARHPQETAATPSMPGHGATTAAVHAASAASAASAQAEVPEGPAWVENIWGLQCWRILGG